MIKLLTDKKVNLNFKFNLILKVDLFLNIVFFDNFTFFSCIAAQTSWRDFAITYVSALHFTCWQVQLLLLQSGFLVKTLKNASSNIYPSLTRILWHPWTPVFGFRLYHSTIQQCHRVVDAIALSLEKMECCSLMCEASTRSSVVIAALET